MIKLSPFQWTAFNFFGFFCAYGVLLPFFPAWLRFHGYTTETVGILIALGYLFRFSGGILFSQYLSATHQLIPCVRLLTWLTLLLLISLFWSANSLLLLLITLAIFHLINGGAMPLNETIASLWQKQQGLDYGKARLFGSISFVFASMSMGYIIGWFGENAILLMMIGYTALLALGQMLPAFPTFTQEIALPKTNASYLDILRNKTTQRMLLAVSLIQSSHAAYYTYSIIYWSTKGISAEISSLLWGIAVIAEIGLFFFSNRLFKSWSIQHLILLSASVTLFRWGILASTADFHWLIVEQIIHALTYGVSHYAMMRYISIQPTHHIVKLQALYFGLASCVLMALFTLISGLVYPYSPTLSFSIMIILVIPALFIVPKKITTHFNSAKITHENR